MKRPEIEYYRPWPTRGTFLMFLLFAAALMPGFWLVLKYDLISKSMLEMVDQCHAPGGQAVWALSHSGLFIQRMICIIGTRLGRPDIILPIFSVLGGSLLLTLLARRKNEWDIRSIRTIVLAGCLGASPLFFSVAITGSPYIWSAIAWFLAVRAMCRIEGKDSIQYEMGLGFALATLIVAEPMSEAFVMGLAVFLPAMLRHNENRNVTAAMALILIPSVMVILIQFLSHAFLSGAPLSDLAGNWVQRELVATNIGAMDPVTTVSISGLITPMLANFPYILGPSIIFTPILPLLMLLTVHRDKKYHPISLISACMVPLLIGLLYSWLSGFHFRDPWVLLILVGLVAWLSETQLKGKWDRAAIITCGVWALAAIILS